MLFLFNILAELINSDPLPKAGLDPVTGNPSSDLIITVFNVIFGILTVIALITVVYGGFKYVISRGEPDKIGKAKDVILYSIIGLVVCFCAFGIINIFLKALL